jgi:hypothetical protein
MNTDKVIARPLFGRAEICSTDNDLLPGEARPELSPGICNAIGEIARSLRRNVAASRLPIAPFLAIRICFGFRASDFGFPAPPACVHLCPSVIKTLFLK